MPLKNHLLVLLVGLTGYVNCLGAYSDESSEHNRFISHNLGHSLSPGSNMILNSEDYQGSVVGKLITFSLTSIAESRFVFNCSMSVPKSASCSEDALSFFEDHRRQVKLCSKTSSYILEFIGSNLTVMFSTGAIDKPRFRCDVQTSPAGGEPHGFVNLGSKTVSCSCGWSNRRGSVGVQETGVNEYVFMAFIKYKKETTGFCGGSIITRHHVLTAAHCIQGKNRMWSKLEVALGSYHLVGEGVSQTLGVEEIFVHKGYNKKTKANDIGLLFLKGYIKFGPNVGPVCLPSAPNMLLDQSIAALGWGLSDNRSSQTLKSVDLQVIDLQTCANSYQNDPGIVITEHTQLCTIAPAKDHCQGDDGGPLVALDPKLNRYVQVALLSHRETNCPSEKPVVNTLLFPFFDWIQKKVDQDDYNSATCELLELLQN